MTKFCAIDLETTGLDPQRHDIIEVGLCDDTGATTFTLPWDPEAANPEALAINKALTRKLPIQASFQDGITIISEWLNEAHIVGKNPAFDQSFLEVLFAEFDAPIVWHHRLVDVGPLAWGYHHGLWHNWNKKQREVHYGKQQMILEPPNTQAVAEFMGIPLPEDQQHAALADAEWAFKVFRTIVPRSI